MQSVVERLEVELAAVRAALARIEDRLGRPTPTCLSTQEAAQRLGVGLTTMKRLIASGEVKTATVGKRRMVPASELERIATPDAARPAKVEKQRSAAWVPIKRRG